MPSQRFNKLRVIVFNVGSGDHILIRFPNGQYGLIDCYFQKNLGQLEVPALSYFRSLPERERKKLAFLHISHPDFDHIKGFSDLWKFLKRNKMLPEQVWVYGGTEMNIYRNMLELVKKELRKKKDTKEASPKRRTNFHAKALKIFLERMLEQLNTEFVFRETVGIKPLHGELGGAVKAYTMAPLPKHIKKYAEEVANAEKKLIDRLLRDSEQNNEETEVRKKEPELTQSQTRKIKAKRIDKNNLSSALLFQFGQAKLFFGGDLNDTILRDCIEDYDKNRLGTTGMPGFDAHFIKGAHHGSQKSSSIDMWKRQFASQPKGVNRHIVFSAGKRYRHPHINTIKQLRSCAERINETIHISSTNMCLSKEQKCEYCLLLQLREENQSNTPVPKQPKSDSIDAQIARMASGYDLGVVREKKVERLDAIVYDIDAETTEITMEIKTVNAPNPYASECIFPSSENYYNKKSPAS